MDSYEKQRIDRHITEAIERAMDAFNAGIDDWLSRCGVTMDNVTEFELVSFTGEPFRLELRRGGAVVGSYIRTVKTTESDG